VRLRPPSPICDDAEFSEDGKRRYWLSRHVAPSGPVGLYLGLNPSTAGADRDDHTVRKWSGFARRFGWTGYWVGNVSTHIEPHSKKLKQLSQAELVGPDDNAVLEALIAGADHIVLCWGNGIPSPILWRANEVLSLVYARARPSAVSMFGLSKKGQPVHPLTLGYDTPLQGYYPPPERASRRDSE